MRRGKAFALRASCSARVASARTLLARIGITGIDFALTWFGDFLPVQRVWPDRSSPVVRPYCGTQFVRPSSLPSERAPRASRSLFCGSTLDVLRVITVVGRRIPLPISPGFPHRVRAPLSSTHLPSASRCVGFYPRAAFIDFLVL